MYFYEILTRTKADKQAFHINAFDHLQMFLNNTKISFYLQLNWEDVCGLSVCVFAYVCVHARVRAP